MRLMIDPGHTGTTDPGATADGLREADITLDVSLRLRGLLSAVRGLDVRLTRLEAVDLAQPYTQAADLRARTDAANGWPADLYLSVHVNAANQPSAHGYETWIFEGASPEARRVATHLHARLAGLFAADRGVKASPSLWVLRQTRMPALLAELGFITNADDRSQLRQPAFRQALAQALGDGLLAAYPALQLDGQPDGDPATAADARLADLTASLAAEQARADALARELARLRDGLRALLA